MEIYCGSLRAWLRRACTQRSLERSSASACSLEAEACGVIGIRPGPEVGKAYRYLLDLRLDEGVLEEAEAEERLRAWWAAQV